MFGLSNPLVLSVLGVCTLFLLSPVRASGTPSLEFSLPSGHKLQNCEGAGLFRDEQGYYAFIPNRCLKPAVSVAISSGSGTGARPLVKLADHPEQGWSLFHFTVETGDDVLQLPYSTSSLTGFAPSAERGTAMPRLVERTLDNIGISLAAYQAANQAGQVQTYSLKEMVPLRMRRAGQNSDEDSATGSSMLLVPSPTPSPDCEDAVATLMSSSITLLDLSSYSALGVNPGGTNGALNSCVWSVVGGSEQDLQDNTFNVPFGGSDPDVSLGGVQRLRLGKTEGDGESMGGLYSYTDTSTMERAIWVQPLVHLFTPGELVARIQNQVSPSLASVQIRYRLYTLHDGGFPMIITFGYSSGSDDEMTVTPLSTVVTTDTAKSQCYQFSLDNLNIASGEYINLHWRLDSAGSIINQPNRDELGIGSVELAVAFPEENLDCIEFKAPISPSVTTYLPADMMFTEMRGVFSSSEIEEMMTVSDELSVMTSSIEDNRLTESIVTSQPASLTSSARQPDITTVTSSSPALAASIDVLSTTVSTAIPPTTVPPTRTASLSATTALVQSPSPSASSPASLLSSSVADTDDQAAPFTTSGVSMSSPPLSSSIAPGLTRTFPATSSVRISSDSGGMQSESETFTIMLTTRPTTEGRVTSTSTSTSSPTGTSEFVPSIRSSVTTSVPADMMFTDMLEVFSSSEVEETMTVSDEISVMASSIAGNLLTESIVTSQPASSASSARQPDITTVTSSSPVLAASMDVLSTTVSAAIPPATLPPARTASLSATTALAQPPSPSASLPVSSPSSSVAVADTDSQTASFTISGVSMSSPPLSSSIAPSPTGTFAATSSVRSSSNSRGMQSESEMSTTMLTTRSTSADRVSSTSTPSPTAGTSGASSVSVSLLGLFSLATVVALTW